MTEQHKRQQNYYVTTFYQFFDWPNNLPILEHSKNLESWCKDNEIKGLIVVSEEGFNGTLASLKPLNTLKKHLNSICKSPINFKDSFTTELHPFRRMKVKLRNEIVTLGDTRISPKTKTPKGVKHISPKEWHERLKDKPKTQILDVRNDFEFQMGSFIGSKNLKMNKFTEFPELIKRQEEAKELKKDEPVYMFCTGGIRCEKASLEMIEQGFNEVYQLDGGILNYIKEYPNEEFKGECFVFDHRVSLDQDLKPSSLYALCVHCGQPTEKTPFTCLQCKVESYGVCVACIKENPSNQTCSKNCSHHYSKGNKTKKVHKDSIIKRNAQPVLTTDSP